MAAPGTPAEAKAARDAAGYRMRQPKVPGSKRCDGCTHCMVERVNFNRTSYDRLCRLFLAPVKTHGTCSRHEAQ